MESKGWKKEILQTVVLLTIAILMSVLLHLIIKLPIWQHLLILAITVFPINIIVWEISYKIKHILFKQKLQVEK